MIFLTTGGNGAGKTLNTLKLIRDRQIAEGRQVYFSNVRMKPDKALEFGWLEFDAKEWEKLPDGSIVLFDECQEAFPPRPNGAKVPQYVEQVAKHRWRGFDLYFTTPHPSMVDKAITKLIASPGWHRHLKRSFGADLVSVLEFSATNNTCEKENSGKNARVTMVPFPKEVYSWYNSASLHTGKKSIPRQVYVLAVLALVIPALIYFGVKKVGQIGDKKPLSPVSVVPGVNSSEGVISPRPVAGPLTVSQYIEGFKPRLDGLPQTAPRYDEITKPTMAPFPSACVQMGPRCDCYTQQGTKLQTPENLCLQIVKNGYFMDWQPLQVSNASSPSASSTLATQPPTSAPAPAPESKGFGQLYF